MGDALQENFHKEYRNFELARISPVHVKTDQTIKCQLYLSLIFYSTHDNQTNSLSSLAIFLVHSPLMGFPDAHLSVEKSSINVRVLSAWRKKSFISQSGE